MRAGGAWGGVPMLLLAEGPVVSRAPWLHPPDKLSAGYRLVCKCTKPKSFADRSLARYIQLNIICAQYRTVQSLLSTLRGLICRRA